MSVNPKRLRALPIAVLALAAVPLMAPAANAAMGGANALTTTLRPDLRSATVQSTNAADDTTTVRVCFSKAIASLPQANKFWMGTYFDAGFANGGGEQHSATALQGSSATRNGTNCADVVFPNFDATQFTYVTVEGSEGVAPDSGLSGVSSNGFGNIQDSVALIGSNTHNGTRGFEVGPDLAGITVNNAGAFIDYTFDQKVQAQTVFGVTAAAFEYVAQNGTVVQSLDDATAARVISADQLTVRVFFPALAAADPARMANAVKASVLTGALVSKAGAGIVGLPNGLRTVARPGTGGFTDAPDLVSVTVDPSRTALKFQFDQALASVGPATDFFYGFSFANNGVNPTGANPPTIDLGPGVGSTVNVPCDTGVRCDQIDEFLVAGMVNAGAVTGVVGGPNANSGVPMGGNVGAFATGFTIAPEALTVSFDNATNIANVLFDQRWSGSNTSQFKLIDDQGSQISATAVNVSGGGTATAGRTTAQVTFPAGALVGARSLLIQQATPAAPFGGVAAVLAGQAPNVVQVISPTAAAAAKATKFRTLKKSAKSMKSLRAAQRAAMRKALKRR